MLDIKVAKLISARTGLGTKFVSKDDKVSYLLHQMSLWKGIDLALKGGTVLNRRYLGENARFSEDIDIDVFGRPPVKGKIALLKECAGGLEGFEVEGPRMMKLTARFDAYYVNEFGERDRVMLDACFADDSPICARPLTVEVIGSGLTGTHPSAVRSYSLEDLLAQKLLALEDRTEGKDVYDLFFGLDLGFDKGSLLKGLELRLRPRGETVEDFAQRLKARREDFSKGWVQIMNSTNHFIPMSKRPEWRSFIRTTFDKIDTIL
jgi:hypothetical protein